jgi:predicted nucleic acid-binding Zn finger protein
MVTAFNILYSTAAVRRLLGLQSSAQVQIREFFKVVWVWVKGQRPTFISKAVFKIHFVEWRKAQARGLKVTERLDRPNAYTVRNECKDSTYIVEARADGVFCGCHDFKNQLEFLGRGCCKHGYAVLNDLGFGSLRDYITARKVIPFPRAAEAPAAYAA